MSDRKTTGQLTTGQKIQQFRDYYMGGALAVLAAAAVIIFMVTRLLSPDQDAAALRIAVFDTELSSEAQEELAQAVRMSLNLPEDAWIVERVWRDMLMPEATDAEYVPPKRFLVMAKVAPDHL